MYTKQMLIGLLLKVDEATRKQREQAYLDAAEAATKNVSKTFMKWCADHEGELEVYACEYCGDDIDIMDSWSTQLLLTTIGDDPDPLYTAVQTLDFVELGALLSHILRDRPNHISTLNKMDSLQMIFWILTNLEERSYRFFVGSHRDFPSRRVG
ncbi:uncharacterized protein ARMOST_18741 [Armillaria ostoyae]|uniref:Uncharacterized protein n=1 Tax=Armillaria ostoyae TaxID=47428 RepID=A0A284S2L1_ARMOS|nr:uncharacterized protein ARMOST_18741 [Armillaria ostoyae]